MTSPDATWRVYLREWLIVYTADFMGSPGEQDCWDHFDRKYAGRVHDDDREVISSRPDWWPVLRLNLWNLRGEFKDEADAVLMLAEHAGSEEKPRVVRRGSPEERALLDYGRKMLPDAG